MNLTEFKQNYDWIHAFDEAFGLGFCLVNDRQTRPAIDGVTEVYAKDEGERDLENWVCVFKYEDGRYGYLSAGCDYTGWD